MRKECNFCNIETEQDRIIRRTDLITSFLSNPKLLHGHVLVVPNYHATLPTELDDSEVIAMHREVRRLTKIMLGSIAVGVDIWQKSRPDVPEGVIKQNHLHTHVLPSNPGNVTYETAIHWGNPSNWSELEVNSPDTQRLLNLLR